MRLTRAESATSNNVEVARVIWDQISIGVKMRVGARNPRASGEGLGALTFNVGYGKLHFITVRLDPSDTYTVTYWRIKVGRHGRDARGRITPQRRERVEIVEHGDIYAEDLSRVIADMQDGRTS